MSRRSRHDPLPAASTTYHGYRNTVPRYQALPQSEICFSAATLDPDMMNANFSLSSSSSGSRHYDVPSWSTTSGPGTRLDDLLPVSGYDSMSLSGTCYPVSMMPTTDAMDVTFDLATGETLSRHAQLNTTSQVSGLAATNMMMDDSSFADYYQDTALMDGAYLPEFGSRGPHTPPDEDDIQRFLDSHPDYGRHSAMTYEPTICEDLGVSKLQPYRLGHRQPQVGCRLIP
jgi:hypothetical protein